MAKISFEIEVELDGRYVPYRAATRWDPEEGGYADSVEITDVGVLDRVLNPKVEDRGSHMYVWRTRSIFQGVDRNNPEVQKMLQNMLEMVRTEAEEAVANEWEGSLP